MTDTTLTESQDQRGITESYIAGVMRQAFLDYSMSVITDRALPDVRDGLKPVHRRILFAMHEAGNVASRAYRKSARTVGDVIGKYHPHGDTSVYGAAVRMAQPFSMSLPLIDGQGNFGSIDGDNAAAMRYTEMRLDRIGTEIFADINKETVAWMPNYDGSEREPAVLPMPYPNLLVNGVEGIAVGMASSIPPHNLREVCAATARLIADPNTPDADLLKIMPGPDFPTEALVHDMDGYAQAFATGRGRVKVRARWHEEDRGRGASALIIDELPYQVNKARLVETISELVAKKKVDGITDLRDESSKEGIRIFIALRKDVSPEVMFNELASKTDIETSFSYNVTALDGVRPKLIGLRDVMLAWIDFRREVVLARHIYDRKQALARQHILNAFLAALGRLDEVIALIRSAKDPQEASAGLQEMLTIDEAQAKAILDLRLHKLTGMEIDSIRTEHAKITALIADLTEVIESPAKIDAVIVDELQDIASRFGRERRTEIAYGLSAITREDLIERENVLVTMTQNGYIKRMPANALRSQNRGTRGKAAVTVDDDDTLTFMREVFSHDMLMIFTESGQVHAMKAYQIPEGSPTSRGRHIKNVIEGLEGEIKAVLSLPETSEGLSVLTVTRFGQVKRTMLDQYDGATRRGGVRGLGLDDGDVLVGAFVVRDTDQLLVVANDGQAIRFNVDQVRAMGRAAAGVRGIRLSARAEVIGAAAIAGQDAQRLCLLCVGDQGVGKRTIIADFPLQGRAGSGVVAFKESRKTGALVAAMAVDAEQDLIMLASNGVSNRMKVSDIRETGRATSGVILMNLDDGAKIVSVTAAVRQEDEGEVADPDAAAATTPASATDRVDF